MQLRCQTRKATRECALVGSLTNYIHYYQNSLRWAEAGAEVGDWAVADSVYAEKSYSWDQKLSVCAVLEFECSSICASGDLYSPRASLNRGNEGDVTTYAGSDLRESRRLKSSVVGFGLLSLSFESLDERLERLLLLMMLSVSFVHEKARFALGLGVFLLGEPGGVSSPIGTR